MTHEQFKAAELKAQQERDAAAQREQDLKDQASQARLEAEETEERIKREAEEEKQREEDKTIVEVYSVDEYDEMELIKTFSQVIAAGFVTDESFIERPRERRFTQCPRCGFIEEKRIKD